MPDHIVTFEKALPLDFCNQVIAKFTEDQRVADDPQPDYSSRRYLNISKCQDWFPVVTAAVSASNDMAESYFGRPEGMEEVTMTDWLDDGFIVAHYKPGDDLALHVDGQSDEEGNNGLRLATALFFLNSPTGGELEFPLQEVSLKPEAGIGVMFPVGFTHPHFVQPAETDRYILQTWLTDSRFAVVGRTLD